MNANCVDPDQTPRSAASDLGLHCLPISLLWEARYKGVKRASVFESLKFYCTCLQIFSCDGAHVSYCPQQCRNWRSDVALSKQNN